MYCMFHKFHWKLHFFTFSQKLMSIFTILHYCQCYKWIFKSELPLSHIMSGISLNHFRPVLFHTLWKNHKTLGFLVFFGGRKLGHWTEIGYGTFSLQLRNPLPAMHFMIKFFMDKIHSPYKLFWLRNPNCWLHSLQDDKRKLRNNAAQ